MHASAPTWIVRLLWASLPVTLGALVAPTLSDRGGAVAWVGAATCWAAWVAVMLAALVPHPVALVVLRVVAPLSVPTGALAATSTAPDALGWLGLATAAVVTVTAMSAEVGMDAINGAAYGDERRFPLRPPAPLLLGPLPAVWVVTAVPLPSGALAAGAGNWTVAVPLLVLGAPGAWFGARSLARLTRRWLVLVPAGLTLVDRFAIVDPVLLRRGSIERLGPAPVGTDATDLTAGAAGLILQVDLSEPVEVTPVAAPGSTAAPVSTDSLLVAPSRPGALLRAAGERRIATAR